VSNPLQLTSRATAEPVSAWSRVLQEVFSHAAVTVHLGQHALPWGSIILAAFWQSCFARHYTATTADDFRGTDARGYLPELWLGLLHTRPQRGLSMMELVSRARDFEATDPRDKVFALLGLANDIGDQNDQLHGLLPDYTTTKDEVYCNFARDLISNTGNLDILSTINTFAVRDQTKVRASGKPHLDVPIATIRGLGFPRKYSASFSTSINSSLLTAHPDDTPALWLSGFELDTVHSVTEGILGFSRELKVYTSDNRDAVVTLWNEYVRPSQTGPENELLQRYVELLTATGFALPTEFPAHPLGRIIPSREVPSLIADFAAYWSRIDPHFMDFHDQEQTRLRAQAALGDADQFGVLVGKACHERKFFTTATGRMGLCPRDTQVGDTVAVLYGGSVPYALRKTGTDFWSFIGECC
jgi:hypothetical protein